MSTAQNTFDPRNYNWLGWRFHEALQSHIPKIQSNLLRNVGGWEAWVQFELMYELSRVQEAKSAAALNTDGTGEFLDVSCDFYREEEYEGSTKRSDFMFTVVLDDMPFEFHSIELKCRSAKEEISKFVQRVRKDVDKVFNLKWDKLDRSEKLISGWIVAISYSYEDEDLDTRMYRIAEEKRIQWKALGWANFEQGNNGGNLKIWTYFYEVRGGINDSFLSYTNYKYTKLQKSIGDSTWTLSKRIVCK